MSRSDLRPYWRHCAERSVLAGWGAAGLVSLVLPGIENGGVPIAVATPQATARADKDVGVSGPQRGGSLRLSPTLARRRRPPRQPCRARRRARLILRQTMSRRQRRLLWSPRQGIAPPCPTLLRRCRPRHYRFRSCPRGRLIRRQTMSRRQRRQLWSPRRGIAPLCPTLLRCCGPRRRRCGPRRRARPIRCQAMSRYAPTEIAEPEAAAPPRPTLVRCRPRRHRRRSCPRARPIRRQTMSRLQRSPLKPPSRKRRRFCPTPVRCRPPRHRSNRVPEHARSGARPMSRQRSPLKPPSQEASAPPCPTPVRCAVRHAARLIVGTCPIRYQDDVAAATPGVDAAETVTIVAAVADLVSCRRPPRRPSGSCPCSCPTRWRRRQAELASS